MDLVANNNSDMESEIDNEDVCIRKINPNQSQWKYKSNQMKRMKGEAYLGVSNNIRSEKPPKQQGLTCTSNFCSKSSLRYCSQFTENTRKEIFEMFWKMSWEQKQQYIVSLVSIQEKKQCFANPSNRAQSKAYFLNNNSCRLQVCRQMFLSTFGLKEKVVRSWVSSAGKHGTALSPEERSNVRIESKRCSVTGKLNKQRRTFLQKWLDELPKMESHYCRKRTKKLYFEGEFSSYQEMYKLYMDKCASDKENVSKKLSFPVFANMIKESNYSIFKPKNDECDICISYKVNNLSEECYKRHREEIQTMREEKSRDIESAESGLCAIFCMDAQAVKLIPRLNANAAYYKMKLQVHNFTVYNVITHDSYNYVWDETDGKLEASVFATCIIKQLKTFHDHYPEIHHIIIYSDGCFYQNRNVTLANALLVFCEETNVTIEQKYLISGHTQMECDATHSLIERKLGKRQMHLPSQFVNIIREARTSPTPLQAYQLHYDYFLNFESNPKRFKSIRPGKYISIVGDLV